MVLRQRQPAAGAEGEVGRGTLGLDRERLLQLARHGADGLLAVGAVLAVVVPVMLMATAARPSWWRAGAGDGASTLADAVDNGAWTVVTQVRPMVLPASGERISSEPWTVSLTAAGATAWLNERLPGWLALQEHPVTMPEGTQMQAAFEPGVIRLTVGLGGSEETPDLPARYVSLAVRPRVDMAGVWMEADSASIGRLTLPTSVVASSGDWAKGDLVKMLRGRTPALRGGVVRLPDGRSVRVMNVEVREGRLELTMRTEAPWKGRGVQEEPTAAASVPELTDQAR